MEHRFSARSPIQWQAANTDCYLLPILKIYWDCRQEALEQVKIQRVEQLLDPRRFNEQILLRFRLWVYSSPVVGGVDLGAVHSAVKEELVAVGGEVS